jgi:hypothetical protein
LQAFRRNGEPGNEMAGPASEIRYSVDFLGTEDATRRIPHRQQSMAATGLLGALEATEVRVTARSRSHSRAVIAVATGNAEGLLLGIDIEFMANRPFEAIMSMYLGYVPAAATPEDFYRGWTFGEAYFKAFQRRPSRSALMQVVQHRQGGHRMVLDDGTEVFTQRVRDVFQLGLVWRSCGFQKVVPVFISPVRPSPEPRDY